MVWTDAASPHPPSGQDVHAQVISPAGSLAGTPFSVEATAENDEALDMAFGGTNFMTWNQSRGSVPQLRMGAGYDKVKN